MKKKTYIFFTAETFTVQQCVDDADARAMAEGLADVIRVESCDGGVTVYTKAAEGKND